MSSSNAAFPQLNNLNSAADDYNSLVQSFKQKSQRAHLKTPSPAPRTKLEEDISVVIPSPSAQLKREIDSAELITDAVLTGVSEEYYPTDVHERRATRGAYPAARKTNRAGVSLVIGNPGPFLTAKSRRPVIDLLCESLWGKLASIKGPAVTVARGDEKILAESTAGFEFINEYKLRDGVTPISPEFNAGCSCDVVCDPARCGCLTQEEDSDARIIPYKRAADNGSLLVLSPEFMARTSMIYECNSLCGCGEKCWNSVIEQGRTVRMEIFNTGNRGFGMSSTHSLLSILRQPASS